LWDPSMGYIGYTVRSTSIGMYVLPFTYSEEALLWISYSL
jgi:hypothetical protein